LRVVSHCWVSLLCSTVCTLVCVRCHSSIWRHLFVWWLPVYLVVTCVPLGYSSVWCHLLIWCDTNRVSGVTSVFIVAPGMRRRLGPYGVEGRRGPPPPPRGQGQGHGQRPRPAHAPALDPGAGSAGHLVCNLRSVSGFSMASGDAFGGWGMGALCALRSQAQWHGWFLSCIVLLQYQGWRWRFRRWWVGCIWHRGGCHSPASARHLVPPRALASGTREHTVGVRVCLCATLHASASACV
jgi:hypothetical protein